MNIVFWRTKHKKIDELTKVIEQNQTDIIRTQKKNRTNKRRIIASKKDIGKNKDTISSQKGEFGSLERENGKKKKWYKLNLVLICTKN